jgi:transposase
MNGSRFVHDRLELAGWQVEIADAQKVKALAPLACKTDRIDAWVLPELASRRDLVPAIWLLDPRVRAERERARWLLHLVRTAPARSSACTQCCSRTASPAPSPTSSVSAAAGCSQSSGCRSRGKGRSRPACA